MTEVLCLYASIQYPTNSEIMKMNYRSCILEAERDSVTQLTGRNFLPIAPGRRLDS